MAYPKGARKWTGVIQLGALELEDRETQKLTTDPIRSIRKGNMTEFKGFPKIPRLSRECIAA